MGKDRDSKGKKKKGLFRRLLVPGAIAGIWFWRKQQMESNTEKTYGQNDGPSVP